MTFDNKIAILPLYLTRAPHGHDAHHQSYYYLGIVTIIHHPLGEDRRHARQHFRPMTEEQRPKRLLRTLQISLPLLDFLRLVLAPLRSQSTCSSPLPQATRPGIWLASLLYPDDTATCIPNATVLARRGRPDLHHGGPSTSHPSTHCCGTPDVRVTSNPSVIYCMTFGLRWQR